MLALCAECVSVIAVCSEFDDIRVIRRCDCGYYISSQPSFCRACRARWHCCIESGSSVTVPFCRVADQFHNSVLNGAAGHIGVGYVWHCECSILPCCGSVPQFRSEWCCWPHWCWLCVALWMLHSAVLRISSTIPFWMVLLATLVLVMCGTVNAPFCRVADQFHNSVLNGAAGHIGVGYVWHCECSILPCCGSVPQFRSERCCWPHWCWLCVALWMLHSAVLRISSTIPFWTVLLATLVLIMCGTLRRCTVFFCCMVTIYS